LDGLNLVGLKRRGVDRKDITALRAAFQMLAQGEGAFQDRAKRLGEETDSAYVQEIVDFILGDSGRSVFDTGLNGCWRLYAGRAPCLG
jgi:UDP-N-acetylglucosamine acyltransferase